jgi:hypothetical protein
MTALVLARRSSDHGEGLVPMRKRIRASVPPSARSMSVNSSQASVISASPQPIPGVSAGALNPQPSSATRTRSSSAIAPAFTSTPPVPAPVGVHDHVGDRLRHGDGQHPAFRRSSPLARHGQRWRGGCAGRRPPSRDPTCAGLPGRSRSSCPPRTAETPGTSVCGERVCAPLGSDGRNRSSCTDTRPSNPRAGAALHGHRR